MYWRGGGHLFGGADFDNTDVVIFRRHESEEPDASGGETADAKALVGPQFQVGRAGRVIDVDWDRIQRVAGFDLDASIFHFGLS